MLFLLTNDDGYRASGLSALREGLSRHGRVVTVAPSAEMSGVSHALTLSRPLLVEQIDDDVYAVDGTPTDCVNLAMNTLLTERPDACVAGVNHGPNLGDDVTYSGTVGGAIEGTLFSLPSIAVSQLGVDADSDFSSSVGIAAELARRLAAGVARLPSGTFLNVNAPRGRAAGVSATVLARRSYRNAIVERRDPRGRTYYWVGGEAVWTSPEGSDQHAVERHGHVSVSLLGTDLSLAVPGARSEAEVGCVDRALEPLVDGLEAHLPGAGGP